MTRQRARQIVFGGIGLAMVIAFFKATNLPPFTYQDGVNPDFTTWAWKDGGAMLLAGLIVLFGAYKLTGASGGGE